MYILDELNNSKVADLRDIAQKLNIPKYDKLKKLDLAYAILDYQAESTSKPKEPEVKIVKKVVEKKVPNKNIQKTIRKTNISDKAPISNDL